MFLRNSVALDFRCNFTHLIGGSPYGVSLSSSQLDVVWFAGNLDFGNLGLFNMGSLS